MKLFDGMYFPDHEVHMIKWMQQRNERVNGKLTYQYHKLAAAMKHVKQFRVAVDVGAHCGMWSMHLREKFGQLVAFEPVAAHRECFEKNVTPADNVILWAVALGDHEDTIAIHTSQGSSGDSWVKGGGDIALRTLDSYDLQDVDFVKLDCEGYEYFALKGGEEMLKRCKPCVLVEQKHNHHERYHLKKRQAVTYLQSLGAVQRFEMGGDHCLAWG